MRLHRRGSGRRLGGRARWGGEGGARPLPARRSPMRASLDSTPFLGPGGGSLSHHTMQHRGGTAPTAAVALLAVALLPTLVALAALPGFITSDGPAHLYNAQILADLVRGDSPYRDVYQVRWAPIPNWGQYLLLMGLMQLVSQRAADHLASVLTLVSFAASVLWLRFQVAGRRGLGFAAVLSALLAINVSWLFGFTSFLMGACLFPLTLGVWWAGRDRLGPGRVLAIGVLLALGYFCHPVSLGLTVIGLVVLAVATPGPAPERRWLWTGVSLVPLVPLGLLYAGVMRSAGGMYPQWPHLAGGMSLRGWAAQLGWADPLTLGSRRIAPFVESRHLAFVVLDPALWAAVAFAGFALLSWGRIDRTRRGWGWLAVLFLLGGFLGPDGLGEGHGGFLTPRVALLGLVALLAWLELDGAGQLARVASAAGVVALALQSAFVWDYGRRTQADVDRFLVTRPQVGVGHRVGVLVLEPYGRYRPAPRFHMDCLLGLGTGNVIWNNYETAHYYFPIQVRPGVPHPPATVFETIALLDGPKDANARQETLRELLAQYHPTIDRLVVWGNEPDLAPLLDRWYEDAGGSSPGGDIRVLRPRAASAASR